MAGRHSQRKGRAGELEDHKSFRKLNLTVIDKRALEAAGVEEGIDYEVHEMGIGVQKKKYGRGNPMLRKSAADEWKKLNQVTSLRGVCPVMHWYEGQGPGQDPLDLALLRWKDLYCLIDEVVRLRSLTQQLAQEK